MGRNKINKKKPFRHSTTFYRKVRLALDNIKGNRNLDQTLDTVQLREFADENILQNTISNFESPVLFNSDFEVYSESNAESDENENNDGYEKDDIKDQIVCLLQELRKWALCFKISNAAVNDLLKIFRTIVKIDLPRDSRTLLHTPTSVNIVPMNPSISSKGSYWHNGLKNCLRLMFHDLNESIRLSLIFNIDGLPISNSSKTEFWPILFRIAEKKLQPMVIGIYCGEYKPPLQQFLTPFVNELNDVLQNGLEINGNKITISVKFFVCDTVARCFIKGVVSFNAYHGCMRCTTIGEFSVLQRKMSFPRTDCPLRTNEDFRNQIDSDHHKTTTPLQEIPIDLVADIIVADSLHLIDLGVMRKCLYMWIDGSNNYRAKWRAAEIVEISNILIKCNEVIPNEIHRAMRKLDVIKYWKGVEFRTFLLYIGPVILKNFLPTDIYEHFLLLFCATTICSSTIYNNYIHVAEAMLKDYIEIYKTLYGKESISSNVHNLCHLTEDVKKFGSLPEMSAYPFESFLGQMKNYLRQGNRPLAQIAKRLTEISKLSSNHEGHVDYPFLSRKNCKEVHELSPRCSDIYNQIHVNSDFILANNNKNKWFMTKNNEIVEMENATYLNKKIYIYGRPIKRQTDFFEAPLNSSYLNIFVSNGEKTSTSALYKPEDIKCKLICIKSRDPTRVLQDKLVFFPLIHTLGTTAMK